MTINDLSKYGIELGKVPTGIIFRGPGVGGYTSAAELQQLGIDPGAIQELGSAEAGWTNGVSGSVLGQTISAIQSKQRFQTESAKQISDAALNTGLIKGPVTPTNSSGLYSSQEAADYASTHTQSVGQGTGGLAVSPTPQSKTLGDIQSSQQPTQYLRQKGTNEVYAIVNGGAYYVPYDYAVANNVFSQVQEIDGRVDQKYPIAGNVSQLPTSGNNTQGGADLGQQGASQTIDPALKAFNEPTQDEIIANLKAMGISDETIAGMTPDNQSMFAALGESLKKQYEQDNPVPQTFTQADLDKIFADAQADPSINEYYKNQLRIGQETFGRTLSYLGAGYTAEQAATAMQQDQQRKQQADQFAQSGAAVSGFRTRAAEQLKSEQQNVITSSKRQLEQQLNQLGAGYEQQFGSSNLPQIGIGGVSYNPIGGVTGDIERQKLLDIQALNQQNINKSALTRGLTT